MRIFLITLILLVTVAVANRILRTRKENFENSTSSKSGDYCKVTDELPGQISTNGVCADVRGSGQRVDYCRVVQPTDSNGQNRRFIACDVGSRGGFNQWFRSESEATGYQVGDMLYFKDVKNTGIEDACRIIYDKDTGNARVSCSIVRGTTIGPGEIEDVNPPEKVLSRLESQKNLIEWITLLNNEKSGKLQNTPIYQNGVAKIEGKPYNKWQSGYSFVNVESLNSGMRLFSPETHAISIMVNPDNISKAQSILETKVSETQRTDMVRLSIVPGGGVMFILNRGNNVAGKIVLSNCLRENQWNHILLTRNTVTGQWELSCDGKEKKVGMGQMIPMVERNVFKIGDGFKGSLADLRFYRNPVNERQALMIRKDFIDNQIQLFSND